MEGATNIFDGDIALETLLDDKSSNLLASFHHFKTVPLLCRIDENNWLSAKGLYVNFLETSRAVFVPQFNLPEDDKIVTIMKNIASKTHGPWSKSWMCYGIVSHN